MSPRKFYVIFRRAGAAESECVAMSGPDARAVAWEVRRKFRGVRIEAIKAVGEGVAMSRLHM